MSSIPGCPHRTPVRPGPPTPGGDHANHRLRDGHEVGGCRRTADRRRRPLTIQNRAGMEGDVGQMAYTEGRRTLIDLRPVPRAQVNRAVRPFGSHAPCDAPYRLNRTVMGAPRCPRSGGTRLSMCTGGCAPVGDEVLPVGFGWIGEVEASEGVQPDVDLYMEALGLARGDHRPPRLGSRPGVASRRIDPRLRSVARGDASVPAVRVPAPAPALGRTGAVRAGRDRASQTTRPTAALSPRRRATGMGQ
jgi:hypothetical protein